MCEPFHSVVQYPTNFPDDDLPLSGQMDSETRLKAALGRVMDWAKRVGDWFHFSKLGSGHTSAIRLSGRSSLYLPEYTSYENCWWSRKFILDGEYKGPSYDQKGAFEAAQSYSNEVCMGSMSKFRRFFETSVKKSTRGELYVVRFIEDVLTAKGRDAVVSKFKRVFGDRNWRDLFGIYAEEQTKIQATKCLMGFTRKRNLFLPHWADDDSLWT